MIHQIKIEELRELRLGQKFLYASNGKKQLYYTFNGNYQVYYEGEKVLETMQDSTAVEKYNKL